MIKVFETNPLVSTSIGPLLHLNTGLSSYVIAKTTLSRYLAANIKNYSYSFKDTDLVSSISCIKKVGGIIFKERCYCIFFLVRILSYHRMSLFFSSICLGGWILRSKVFILIVFLFYIF